MDAIFLGPYPHFFTKFLWVIEEFDISKYSDMNFAGSYISKEI